MTSHDLQPPDRLANQQLRALLEDAIDKLAVNYRSVYILRAVEQLNTRETAHSLDITEDVVKTRYRRAKKMLRATFQGHLDRASLNSYEFAGHRCDAIVEAVLIKLGLAEV